MPQTESALAGVLRLPFSVNDAAWDQIRMVNDQIKAQSKHHPELSIIFKPVTEFFARGPRKSKAEL